MFRANTAAFVHDLGADVLANVEGDSNYVRVQVPTDAVALDRAKPGFEFGADHQSRRPGRT